MKASQAAFDVPDRNTIVDLTMGAVEQAGTLKETDLVICINRGRKALTDMYDGHRREIPPGRFLMEYGPAQHFQKKCIVPGTRNIEVGGWVSYIGILGSSDGRIKVDHEEMCQPFTDEELQSFGERVEGIDRSALSDPNAREVQVIRTPGLGGLRRTGGSMRPQVDVSKQASEIASEAAAHVFEPSSEPNAAKLDEMSAASDRGGEAARVLDELPQPRPMRSQRR